MQTLHNHAEALAYIFSKVGKSLHIATPLGLGKPNQLLNQIYERAKQDSSVKLKIFTALSLDFEKPQGDFETRFLGPFYERHFGANYPVLKYVEDLKSETLPQNVEVHEFYMQAGALLKSQKAQSSYISLNYTHVSAAIYQHDINVALVLIAKSPDGRYSLSCNPDLTLDVKDLYQKKKAPLLLVGVVHPDLPFLGGDAEVSADFFDAILETPEVNHKLFALPRGAVTAADHLIGFYGSQLIVDDGTLQIGIGSLSDALVNSVILRQQKNSLYKSMMKDIWRGRQVEFHYLNSEVFEKGLYGTSEMVMDGFMHLRKAGVLTREIYDHDESARRYLHGAFFLGSQEFYKWLSELQGADYAGLSMTRVSKVNDLYDEHEMALRRQRKKARFFNTCMNVTLLGGAASDTLENGGVVSGVGGQYNFVAMAHELDEALSVLMLRSTRMQKGRRVSNIIPHHGQITIPRHLRDVVVTEYGIAFLRGESDERVIQKLIEISDSEFQEELMRWGKKNKKLGLDYEIPEEARNNTPQKIQGFYQAHTEVFATYPFGMDFTSEEARLGKSLLSLKKLKLWQFPLVFFNGWKASVGLFENELLRMKLLKPKSLKEFLMQKILLGVLNKP